MDIDLLSKMVKELILDNDKVVLPGLGSFVAEIVPSTFSDKGYTINPPYRKMYFRAKPDEGSALVEFYSSSNGVDMEIADRIVRDFVSELRVVLFSRKMVVFPGLGRLRATKENTVFFIADEDLDIYPEGFALEPISLKTHVETKEEVAVVMEELKMIVEEPVVVEEAPETETIPAVEEEPQPSDVPETVEEVPAVEAETIEELEVEEETEVAEEIVEVESEVVEFKPYREPAPAPAKKKSSFWRVLGKTVLALIITALVALAAFMLVARFMPDFLDSILYTPEELEIINKKIC